MDRYCQVAGLMSLISCAFPLIALIAMVLAILGLRRVRRTGARGTQDAIAAIILSLIGIVVFFGMMSRLRGARLASVSLECQSNLRSVGQFILLYETAYRGPRGYTLEDVAKDGQGQLPANLLSCPDPEPPSPGKPIPTYVMLTSLEPFSGIADPATTVVVFELHAHHVPASDGFPESNHVNALFADGHVEGLPVDKAAGIIEKSLLAPRRGATTRPTR
jgi:prepilin-type processing-associated H-X9-DG protein